MKVYVNVILAFVFLFINYFGFKLVFLGMTYPNDMAFVVGVLGMAMLVTTDIVIGVHVAKALFRTGGGK